MSNYESWGSYIDASGETYRTKTEEICKPDPNVSMYPFMDKTFKVTADFEYSIDDGKNWYPVNLSNVVFSDNDVIESIDSIYDDIKRYVIQDNLHLDLNSEDVEIRMLLT